MKNSYPIAIIGGYDSISKSFFLKIKQINDKSILYLMKKYMAKEYLF